MSRPGCLFLSTCSLMVACAEGQQKNAPVTQVSVDANHVMYGFGGNQGIAEFPIPAAKIGSDEGFLKMTANGDYTISRVGQATAAAVQYQVATDGSFALVVPVPGRARTRFLGAYQQADAGDLTQAYFFTDRYAPKNSQVVGFFWGTRTVSAHTMADARDQWHLFSQHVLLGDRPRNINNVGRSLRGLIEIKAKTGSDDEIIGKNGTDSSGRPVALAGSARAIGGNGEMDLTVSYDGDNRTISASQAKDLILGLDADETDGETGLFALVRRKVFATAAEHDAAKLALAGSWNVGLHTIFVEPTVSGIDAANGTLTIEAAGGWRLEGVGSKGPNEGKFKYSGRLKFQKLTGGGWDNLIELTVDGTSEVWWAAVDAKYGVLVIVDVAVENRPNPQLNIGLAIKQPATK